MNTIDNHLKSIRLKDGRTLYEVQLKKNRITAIVLGSSTIISLVFLVFAFNQKAEAARIKSELEALRIELRQCKGSK